MGSGAEPLPIQAQLQGNLVFLVTPCQTLLTGAVTTGNKALHAALHAMSSMPRELLSRSKRNPGYLLKVCGGIGSTCFCHVLVRTC